ncbi:hypothetical protein ACOSP7_013658 [Xanthoceras sorbifolium]
MKKTIWDWKQQLRHGLASLPLVTLKCIYGESSATGEVVKADIKSSPNKFVV